MFQSGLKKSIFNGLSFIKKQKGHVKNGLLFTLFKFLKALELKHFNSSIHSSFVMNFVFKSYLLN